MCQMSHGPQLRPMIIDERCSPRVLLVQGDNMMMMDGDDNYHIEPASGATGAGVRSRRSWPLLAIYSSRRAHLVEQLAFACQHEGNLIRASVAMHSLVQDVRVQVQKQDVLKDIRMSLPTSIIP